jgi:PHP domain
VTGWSARLDSGEIEAAIWDELPVLVAGDDIRGDLRTHTDLTDGVASLEDMVATAAGRGYEYYAITDHAPSCPRAACWPSTPTGSSSSPARTSAPACPGSPAR